MDTEAKPIENDMWLVTDLLGRKLATVVHAGLGFLIEYDLPERLGGVVHGPHETLDDALGAIAAQFVSGDSVFDHRLSVPKGLIEELSAPAAAS